MKIYGEGKHMMGSFIKGLLIAFVKNLGQQLIVCKGPPIMEIYAAEAETGKPIDLEINVHLTKVIVASQRRGNKRV